MGGSWPRCWRVVPKGNGRFTPNSLRLSGSLCRSEKPARRRGKHLLVFDDARERFCSQQEGKCHVQGSLRVVVVKRRGATAFPRAATFSAPSTKPQKWLRLHLDAGSTSTSLLAHDLANTEPEARYLQHEWPPRPAPRRITYPFLSFRFHFLPLDRPLSLELFTTGPRPRWCRGRDRRCRRL